MENPKQSRHGGSSPRAGSALERLANLLDMPAEDVREAARNIARKRIETKHAALMEKVRLIRERNTAILPTGEIVARDTPGAMPYDSPQNADVLAPASDTEKLNEAADSGLLQPRLVRWFLRQFTDYRWARRKLGGRWQKWVPENGKNNGFWLEGVIVPNEIADILKMKGYVATPEVEIYPAND